MTKFFCLTFKVHHKTEFGSNLTGHGFPDPGHLDNVLEELRAQGITEDDGLLEKWKDEWPGQRKNRRHPCESSHGWREDEESRRIKQEVLEWDTLSLPALKRGAGGTFWVIQDIDFVLQRLTLFKMLIVSPLGSPVNSVQVCPNFTVFGQARQQKQVGVWGSCSTDRKATWRRRRRWWWRLRNQQQY